MAKKTIDRITTVGGAWENLRPNKQFSGLSLENFKERTKPSLEIRAQMTQLESQLRALAAQLVKADETSEATVNSVVNGVKGDLQEGDDGELYEAMGFTRKSARRSGLARKRAEKPATPNGATSS
jgi:hypothetical protein